MLLTVKRSCLHCSGEFESDSDFCCEGCETAYKFLSETQKKSKWSYLDSTIYRKKVLVEEVLKLEVTGIHCASCVWSLENLRKWIPGVEWSTLDLSRGILSIKVNENQPISYLIDFIGSLGYEAKLASNSGYGNSKDQRSLLIKLGIAAACSANIMILSVAVYAGVQDEMRKVFEWIQAVLFLPVFIFCSQPFYKTSFQALQAKKPTVDWPITLAIVVGGGLSYRELLLSGSHLFFDSLSILVFLLLASRYLLFRIQSKYKKDINLSDFLSNGQVYKVNENSLVPISISEIEVGDVLEINRNERIPADGKIISETSYINPSLLTGETLPILLRKGESCFAGTESLTDKLLIKVTSISEQTRMGKFLEKVKTELSIKSRQIQKIDKFAYYLTIFILAVGTSFFLIYSQFDIDQAIRRSLALVVLACPCALGFAAPLTESLSIKKAAKEGVIVKSGDVFENLQSADKYIFDKTGTLTFGSLSFFQWVGKKPKKEDLKVLLEIERASIHPVARCLVKEIEKDIGTSFELKLQSFEEVPGSGVRAKYKDQIYELLQSTDSSSKYIEIDVIKNGKRIAKAQFEDSFRPENRTIIDFLKKSGKKVYLLSGDSSQRIKAAADEFELLILDRESSSSNPERKMQLVKESQSSVMIGDGTNDSGAMALSQVSIAVQGAVESSLQVADVYFLNEGLRPLQKLLNISRRHNETLKRLFKFSVIYNLTGSLFALLGYIDPLVAALLMPMSSFSVLFISLQGVMGTDWQKVQTKRERYP